MVMKTESEIRRDMKYWQEVLDGIELEEMKPPIRLVIGVLKGVLGEA